MVVAKSNSRLIINARYKKHKKFCFAFSYICKKFNTLITH